MLGKRLFLIILVFGFGLLGFQYCHLAKDSGTQRTSQLSNSSCAICEGLNALTSAQVTAPLVWTVYFATLNIDVPKIFHLIPPIHFGEVDSRGPPALI